MRASSSSRTAFEVLSAMLPPFEILPRRADHTPKTGERAPYGLPALPGLPRPAAIAPDVVMLDDIHEEDRVLLDAKDDAVAAADPRFEIALVRKDGLHVQAGGVDALDERHRGAIAGCLPIRRQLRIALPPLPRPGRGRSGGAARQAPYRRARRRSSLKLSRSTWASSTECVTWVRPA